MGARTRSMTRAAIAACLAVSLLGGMGLRAAAQEGDLCGLLTDEDFTAILPGTYATQGGFEGTCGWSGSTDDGTGVLILGYVAPGSASDMPGADVIDLDGRPAFSMRDPANPVPTHVVGVETDAGLLVLTLTVEDEAVDVEAVATALTRAALARFESGAGPAATTPAAEASASATSAPPSAPGTAVSDDLCARATPEEIAAAAGLDVTLTLAEFDGTCSYDSITDDGYVLIYVGPQDPATFDATIAALGGEEIEGPGETDWWVGSLASLFSRTGDEVLQVSYSSNPPLSEDELRETAIAILTAFLAP
jgi:hypothetical protein